MTVAEKKKMLLEKASEIQQPFFGIHFVDGENRDQAFKPSGVRPCENGVLFNVRLEVLQRLMHIPSLPQNF